MQAERRLSGVRLGYSNYGMRTVDVFAALPRLQSMGYGAIEICARDGWQTAADRFGASERRRLAALLRKTGFPPAPVMESLSVCAMGRDATAMLRRAEDTFALARAMLRRGRS